MISLSMQDFLRAILFLLFIEGAAYLLLPNAIQNFAVRCLVDAKPANLRLFGAVLIAFGIFLMMFVFPFLGE